MPGSSSAGASTSCLSVSSRVPFVLPRIGKLNVYLALELPRVDKEGLASGMRVSMATSAVLGGEKSRCGVGGRVGTCESIEGVIDPRFPFMPNQRVGTTARFADNAWTSLRLACANVAGVTVATIASSISESSEESDGKSVVWIAGVPRVEEFADGLALGAIDVDARFCARGFPNQLDFAGDAATGATIGSCVLAVMLRGGGRVGTVTFGGCALDALVGGRG